MHLSHKKSYMQSLCALVQCFGFEFVAESACITVWNLLRALNLWPSRPASQLETCCQLGWVLENKNSLTHAAQRILLFLFCGVCLDGLRRRQCFPPISNAICMFSALWCSLAWAWHWAHPHVLICESGSDLTLSILFLFFSGMHVCVCRCSFCWGRVGSWASVTPRVHVLFCVSWLSPANGFNIVYMQSSMPNTYPTACGKPITVNWQTGWHSHLQIISGNRNPWPECRSAWMCAKFYSACWCLSKSRLEKPNPEHKSPEKHRPENFEFGGWVGAMGTWIWETRLNWKIGGWWSQSVFI